jgi:hypothetical protein
VLAGRLVGALVEWRRLTAFGRAATGALLAGALTLLLGPFAPGV